MLLHGSPLSSYIIFSNDFSSSLSEFNSWFCAVMVALNDRTCVSKTLAFTVEISEKEHVCLPQHPWEAQKGLVRSLGTRYLLVGWACPAPFSVPADPTFWADFPPFLPF